MTRQPPDDNPEISQEIADDAEVYLERIGERPRLDQMNHLQQTEWFSNRIVQAAKMSRTRHVKVIAEIYAVYAIMKSNEDIRPSLTSVARHLGIAVSERKSTLRLLIEIYLDYGDDSEFGLKHKQNNFSRDVAAIKFLIRAGISPSEVVPLSNQGGEGLNSWSRRHSKIPGSTKAEVVITDTELHEPRSNSKERVGVAILYKGSKTMHIIKHDVKNVIEFITSRSKESGVVGPCLAVKDFDEKLDRFEAKIQSRGASKQSSGA